MSRTWFLCLRWVENEVPPCTINNVASPSEASIALTRSNISWSSCTWAVIGFDDLDGYETQADSLSPSCSKTIKNDIG